MADIDLDTADRGDTLPEAQTTPETAETDLEPDPIEQTETEQEVEGEETDEERAQREAEEAEAEKPKRIRVPKARLDAAMEKARLREAQLQARIAELESKQVVKQQDTQIAQMEDEIEQLQDEYEDLLMDGKKAEAKAVRQKVSALNKALIETQTTLKSQAAKTAAIDDLKFDAALAAVETAHPQLNPDHASYDDDKASEVAEMTEAFMLKGLNRTVALTKAVKYVMGEPAAERSDEAAEVIKQQRAEAARKKAADANKRQPASTNKVGLNSDQAGKTAADAGIDVMRLSQDKFAKLDEDTLAKLRGDTV